MGPRVSRATGKKSWVRQRYFLFNFLYYIICCRSLLFKVTAVRAVMMLLPLLKVIVIVMLMIVVVVMVMVMVVVVVVVMMMLSLLSLFMTVIAVVVNQHNSPA